MHIIVVGINHKTSAIGVREKFYLQPSERELLLSELKGDPRVSAAFVLSTCNRTEIYAHVLELNPDIILNHLFIIKKLTVTADLRAHFYFYADRCAVEHVLRVTTGLDSLIIGEKQILGQMREAFDFSTQRVMMDKEFNILANLVLQTGKKVRHETSIDHGGSSVSWAAVIKAQEILGTLENKKVLILGSGKMGRLAVEQLKNKGVGSVCIMNRTLEKAQELASLVGAEAAPFWNIKEVLADIDVCVCSSGATHYLIQRDLVEAMMSQRQHRPLVMVDISVPRNIDPDVSLVSNTTLVAVDDLVNVVENNMKKRQESVKEVQAIVDAKVHEFYRTLLKRSSFISHQESVSLSQL